MDSGVFRRMIFTVIFTGQLQRAALRRANPLILNARGRTRTGMTD